VIRYIVRRNFVPVPLYLRTKDSKLINKSRYGKTECTNQCSPLVRWPMLNKTKIHTRYKYMGADSQRKTHN